MDTASLKDDILVGAMEEYNQRLEYELRGAWMAGFDYVHIYRETEEPIGPGTELSQALTFRRWVFPTNLRNPPDPPEREYEHTYDLAEADDDAIREAMRNAR